MAVKFLTKYFPPAKSTQLKIEISTFRQMDSNYMKNGKDWEKIEIFYNGLNAPTWISVDSAAGGTIFSKNPIQAHDMLEQMTINSFQWSYERMGVQKAVEVYAVDPITSISAQLSALTTQVVALNKVSVADLAGASMASEEFQHPEQAQYINQRGYGGYRGNLVPNTYHPDLRNHEKFSYSNNQNMLNPPLGFNTNKGEGKMSLEDVVNAFVTESSKRMARIENRLDSLETDSKSAEEAERREEESEKPTEAKNSKVEEIIVEEKKSSVEEKPMFKPTLPYPQRFKKKALDEQFSKFLEIFKKIHINVPFVDALEQMPNYAKFIKDVMSKKRRLQDNEVVNLTKECSAGLATWRDESNIDHTIVDG
ncbi:uncharacterized protein [Henckelia pumila]|uniref:uncharacterized protein n=1 Tax=Henckelia pumila TaxID=405737 RepID=UPI003C6DFBE9